MRSREGAVAVFGCVIHLAMGGLRFAEDVERDVTRAASIEQRILRERGGLSLNVRAPVTAIATL